MSGDAIFAGFVCGHLLAIIGSPLLATTLFTIQGDVNGTSMRLPPILIGLPPVLLAVPLFMFGVVLCSMLGLIFAAVFILLQNVAPMPLPATPNLIYSLVVLFFVTQIGVLMTFLLRRLHWTVVAFTGCGVLLFGWVLPNLALLNQ